MDGSDGGRNVGPVVGVRNKDSEWRFQSSEPYLDEVARRSAHGRVGIRLVSGYIPIIMGGRRLIFSRLPLRRGFGTALTIAGSIGFP